jgi:hypothetical protein
MSRAFGSSHWYLFVIVAIAVSYGLRTLAWRWRLLGERDLAAARKALGLRGSANATSSSSSDTEPDRDA